MGRGQPRQKALGLACHGQLPALTHQAGLELQFTQGGGEAAVLFLPDALGVVQIHEHIAHHDGLVLQVAGKGLGKVAFEF